VPSEKNKEFLVFVMDQLAGLRRVSARPMFGCIGLYSGDDFFAIIDDGRLFFCTDEITRPEYVAAGTKPFHGLRSYHEIPVDVLEDDIELRRWARRAVEVHRRKHKKPRRAATS